MKLATWIIVAGALTACNKKDSKSGAGSGSATTTTVGGITVTTSVNKVDATAVDPAIMKLAKDVVASCKWNEDGYYPMDCPARKPWDELRLEKTGAATLVAILEDPAPGMKWLAANAMYKNAEWFADNKDFQDKILAVAAALPKDNKGGTGNEIGRVIGFMNLTKTGNFDKAKAIVDKADAHEALRIGIVNWILAGNPDSVPAYGMVYDAATKATAIALKVPALIGLSGAYNAHAPFDDVCKAWLDALPTIEDDDAAAMVAAHLLKGDLQINNQNNAFPYNWAMISSDDNKCPAATVDAGLKVVAAHVNDGKATSSWWTSALRGPSKSKNATPEQKQAAVDILKAYADNAKYGGYQRGGAIELLAEVDPASGKTYADKYADDKDSSLKGACERAHKTLDKKK